MARETWVVKVKSKLSQSLDSVRQQASSKRGGNVGLLALEMGGVMSRLLHLWHSLSDLNITRLRNHSIRLQGVRKIVSNDDVFLLGLACAELVHSLRLVATSVSRLSRRCDDPALRSFDRLFHEFADSGRDPQLWTLSPKDMDACAHKMDRYATATAALSWQRREVKYLKNRSLWNRSFDSVTAMLVRSIFTVLARIKLVFGVGVGSCPAALPRAAVHPSDPNPSKCESNSDRVEFLEANSEVLKAPETTLGAAALSLHYANLIIVMEKMIKAPQLVGVEARDDLYGMLPASVRAALRGRLRGVGLAAATDGGLAGEWRDALGKILGWLSPLAHNMIKWQSERSLEHQSTNTNVMLFQTLFFANRDKAEAAITELLVGLNYICRFHRETTAKALFHCSNGSPLFFFNNSRSDSHRPTAMVS